MIGPVAREIAQREGLRAVLEGSIAALGSHYALMVSAVDPRTGTALTSDKEEAEGKEDVLKALDRLASRLRRRLGESFRSVEQRAVPLERATTSSFEALVAFDQGRKEQTDGRNANAIARFERAVELDPDFARAHAHLSSIHSNLGNTRLAAESAQRAFALRDRVSESERFQILSTYHRTRGDLQKRTQDCELWVRTYPRDYTARVHLSTAYSAAGRFEEAAEQSRHAIAIDPNRIYAHSNLCVSYYIFAGRLDEAKSMCEETTKRFPDFQGHQAALYYIARLQGDRATAERELGWSKGKPQEAEFIGYLRQQESQRGQLTEQRNRIRQAAALAGRKPPASSSEHAWNLALAGHLALARAEARAALKEFPGNRTTIEAAAFALALAGETGEAERLAAELAAAYPDMTLLHARSVPRIRAAAAYARGHWQEAIDALGPSKPYEGGEVFSQYFRGLAYLRLGSASEALAAFQSVIDRPYLAQFAISHPLARLGKARAAAMAGDLATSRAAYQDFLTWWKDADPDIPVLIAAKAEYAKLQQ